MDFIGVNTLALLEVLSSVLCGNYFRRKEQFVCYIYIFYIFSEQNISDLWVRNDNDNPIILTNRLLILHTAYNKCQTNISVFLKKMDG